MNYFELFEMPISLSFDKAQLSKKYFELQKKYHPDFFSQSDEEEQSAALEKSSAINKAFKIFQHTDETIKYVLQLKGLLQEDEKYQLPPDFLMEMMEMNEELDENSQDIITQRENDIYNPVKAIIETYNDELITTAELLKVKEYYFKKKYLQRILDRIND